MKSLSQVAFQFQSVPPLNNLHANPSCACHSSRHHHPQTTPNAFFHHFYKKRNRSVSPHPNNTATITGLSDVQANTTRNIPHPSPIINNPHLASRSSLLLSPRRCDNFKIRSDTTTSLISSVSSSSSSSMAINKNDNNSEHPKNANLPNNTKLAKPIWSNDYNYSKKLSPTGSTSSFFVYSSSKRTQLCSLLATPHLHTLASSSSSSSLSCSFADFSTDLLFRFIESLYNIGSMRSQGVAEISTQLSRLDGSPGTDNTGTTRTNHLKLQGIFLQRDPQLIQDTLQAFDLYLLRWEPALNYSKVESFFDDLISRFNAVLSRLETQLYHNHNQNNSHNNAQNNIDCNPSHSNFIFTMRCFDTIATTSFTRYFTAHWNNLNSYRFANEASLWHTKDMFSDHDTFVSTKCPDPLSDDPTNQVHSLNLLNHDHFIQQHLKLGKPVLIRFYSDYCSKCKRMSHVYHQAALKYSNAVASHYNSPAFAEIDGVDNYELLKRYGVVSYPKLVFVHKKGDFLVYNKDLSTITENDILQFIRFRKNAVLQSEHESHKEDEDHDHNHNDPCLDSDVDTCHVPPQPSASTLDTAISPNTQARSNGSETDTAGHNVVSDPWTNLLSKYGIDEIDSLLEDRKTVRDSLISKALTCDDESLCRPPQGDTKDPPLLIFLGGGMASGKTSVLRALKETRFWKISHGQAVIIEPDGFKLKDPMFNTLHAMSSKLSELVHADSFAAAEITLLQAVSQGRDIIFDGTLSWYPFVQQTVEMLKDRTHYYRRGPGFIEENGIVKVERYFEREARLIEPRPNYRVILLGVTVDPRIAIARGILRFILEGRSVPIPAQLNSHKLFSQNFDKYVDLFDEVYLFDRDDHHHNENMFGNLIAVKDGSMLGIETSSSSSGKLDVVDLDLYEKFLNKRNLNTHATCIDELYL